MGSGFQHSDVLVIGGGPAGLAAASNAAQSRLRVTIVDDNHGPGGQIWRGDAIKKASPKAANWFRKIEQPNISFITGASVFHHPERGLLLAESLAGVHELSYDKLIIATGARERFLPFPGWTLPNVMGAGGLQALVKSGLPIRGKRVVVAGSGPLLLAVAAYLRETGADVRLIAEQAPFRRLAGFAFRLGGYPGKAAEAFQLKKKLAGVRHFAGCWPIRASGADRLADVTLRQGRRTWTVPCDYLACGFHLLPNLEVAHLLGCRIDEGAVFVDEFQETSISGVFCAGESTGIGGLELSLVEGQIAGRAAAGDQEGCRQFFSLRQKYRRFADILNRTFELRNELKGLSAAQTIVCRCEDVTFASIGACNSWREAKMQTRCGMGPCQGRVCGAALEFLMDWKPDSIRPPIIPVRLDSFFCESRRGELVTPTDRLHSRL